MLIGILSRNPKLYSTRRLSEAAIQRGHMVKIIDHLKCFVGIEGGNPIVKYKGAFLDSVSAIIPRIGASVTSYGTAIVRQFEAQGIFVVNRSLAINRSRDKLRALQLLTRAEINVPKTVFASRPTDIHEILHYLGGTPVIIKLLEGTQGIGVILAETEKAAISVIEAFHGLNADILIQEYIRESGGADIRAFVVNGEVVASMKRQGKEGEFRSNLHRGGYGENVELSNEEKEASVKAAEAMGLGVAGVDMLRSKRGPLIIEINSSPGLEGIEKITKVDIAGKIIEYIETHKPEVPECI
jgi:ribosomal protein S6--L-glutamate ligase